MLANFVQIRNLTPVLGGSLAGKSDPGFIVFNNLTTASTKFSWLNWLIDLISGVSSLQVFSLDIFSINIIWNDVKVRLHLPSYWC